MIAGLGMYLKFARHLLLGHQVVIIIITVGVPTTTKQPNLYGRTLVTLAKSDVGCSVFCPSIHHTQAKLYYYYCNPLCITTRVDRPYFTQKPPRRANLLCTGLPNSTLPSTYCSNVIFAKSVSVA